jgi:hypothetical protein
MSGRLSGFGLVPSFMFVDNVILDGMEPIIAAEL